MTAAQQFHGITDRATSQKEILATPLDVILPGNKPTSRRVSVEYTQLRYRFDAHFHPFVQQLTKRLLEGSVRALQAADTEFQTAAKLSAAAQASGIDGGATPLAANETVQIRDGAFVRLADGTQVRLSGRNVVKVDDGSLRRLGHGEAVTLPRLTMVKRADGKSAILSNDTAVVLTLGNPQLTLYREFFDRYLPAATPPAQDAQLGGAFVEEPRPVKEIDFSSSGSYSAYNWELFYHVPLLIAIHLSRNQRYAESQQWFHYIFDPTDDSDGPAPERYWKVKPFQTTDVHTIEELLINLSTKADPQLRDETIKSINRWRQQPFQPFAVARYRHSAFMYKAVMAYLDNLIDWGDSLFRTDSPEAVDEAVQLYVLAASILGPRPDAVPAKGAIQPRTYANLRPHLNEFNDALVEIEASCPFDLGPFPAAAIDGDGITDGTALLSNIGSSLYFCVPPNDKLMGYWTTVADRLFKVHNSLNIQGVFRQLPLFDPPIDPALLARAAAAGLDVAAVVSGVNQPLPLQRFAFWLQKSLELCQDVKSLGASVLSAIEKEDNEALSLLRSRHERAALAQAETIRYGQWQESIKNREGLLKTLASAIERYRYFERQLGAEDQDVKIPELDAIDRAALTKLNLRVAEPELSLRDINVDIASDLGGDAGGYKISSHERKEIDSLAAARLGQDVAAGIDLAAQAMALLPDFEIKFHYWGIGGGTKFGGSSLSTAMAFSSNLARTLADKSNYEAGGAGRLNNFARREQDWAYQSNAAAAEINQIFKQLRAAEIREALAEVEWKNHVAQMERAEEIEKFLQGEKVPGFTGKKSTQAFYAWMKRESKGLYARSFQLAFDVARKAERALQHELGNRKLTYIEYGYLAGIEGLLAGEKLAHDVKRMECAYHDLNQREFEITRNASLLQLSPMALLQLRQTGRCVVQIPESLFDMGGAGEYFRRIRSVAVSIPCVTGPYAGVNCKLTLLKSTIRRDALLDGDDYARNGPDDARFEDYYGRVESIVTSTAQNDSGLFETNLRDERYLPFEGAGAISDWQLELPSEVRLFDYDTIADVVLHIRYTARDGGAILQGAANSHLVDLIENAQGLGSVRLFSVRHEFPNEWARFKRAVVANASPAELKLTLREEHYPYWSRDRRDTLHRVALIARTAKNSVKVFAAANGAGTPDTLEKDATLADLRTGTLRNIASPAPVGAFSLFFDDNSMEELWMAVTWGV